ncbi:MAG: DegT/DnrJ/EryC1/StrS family aminotransferase, partial [Chitinivibrionales bacterium]|nr:DegT/DnrJ/EryC1/StrS family aminotransferase [Chitinivibrionales bacterium]
MITLRSLPPAAAPITLSDICRGLIGLLNGKKEAERFRRDLKSFFGARHCFAVSSGKAALYCILKALHSLSPDRDEVLIPAFNCYCVPAAVLKARLKIRLCDINADTLDFDESELARNLQNNRKLLCIIPTHLFGLRARVKRPVPAGVTIVEDAAQVMGSSQNGKFCGLAGDVGFFSLSRGKAISCVEGG